ncbi:MAG: bifunctional DNA-binding transcriptional regulator/O6-methylguanine-DNA methyltransferase Ada [Sandaracinaceae bacterium]
MFAVRTTGVFCYPSCGARTPRRLHVTFFATPEEAAGAGYRPCRRCRPDLPPARERRARSIARICRHLERVEGPHRLGDLAARAGLSPSHFHRVFRAVTGMTPKAYERAARQRRLRRTLSSAPSVSAAAHDAGYTSTGRFYADAAAGLGMSPARYRRGGAGETLRVGSARSRLGVVLVAATHRGVCWLGLGDDAGALEAEVRRDLPAAALEPDDGALGAWLAAVLAYVEAPETGLDLPLDVRGTAFQCQVWAALRELAPGETVTYRELAERLGRPTSSRAVARACATNPVSLAIPCHRVVGSDGSLRGYRWGIERKRALLDGERA